MGLECCAWGHDASLLLRGLYLLLYLRWEFGYGRVLAELQGTDVGRDSPAVLRRYLLLVCRHGAIARAHDDEKMAYRRLAQTGNMERRWMRVPPLHDHAMPRPHVIVTRGTIDVVPFSSTRQQLVCEWQWQVSHLFALDSAGVQGLLKVQLAARHGAGHEIAG